MNERIRKLAEQSGITFKQMIIDGDEYDYYHVQCNDDIGSDEADCIKKFAELIVRECAKRVDYWESRQGEHTDDILKYFGVEE